MNNPHNAIEPKRAAIRKSLGSTPTEQYLAQLSEKSFLGLWSYPNPYRDQRAGVGNNGKELCDLLVVCGNHIIIFSEKNIQWPDINVKVGWSRWYKKAIHSSVKQLRGAERWMIDFPDRIFLDPNCTVPFPIDFPDSKRRIVHKIVVARGAGEASQKYFDGGIGSLAINPKIVGERHWNTYKFDDIEPFVVGDVNPDEGYIHVIDDASLDVIMKEFDTITDFTDYLQKKAQFARSGRLEVAHGEEELIAYYCSRVNEDGDHDFYPNPDENWDGVEPIGFDGSHYPSLMDNPQYILKKEADEISYVWDELINLFTKHMLEGTSVSPPGFDYSLKQCEIGVRYMALQPRILRRNYGNAILGAMEIGAKNERFIRAMIGLPETKFCDTGFFFLTFNWPKDKATYQRYREMRSYNAQVYAQAFLVEHPHLKRIVGIAVDASSSGGGSSEDLLYMEQENWSEQSIVDLRKECDNLGIMQPSLTRTEQSVLEYPQIPDFMFYQKTEPPKKNRKQRRATKTRQKKST